MRPNFLIYRNGLEREHPDIAQKDHLKEGPSVCIPSAQFSVATCRPHNGDVKTDLLTRLIRERIRCTRMDNPRITSSA